MAEKSFLEEAREAKEDLIKSGASCGPMYSDNHGGAPLKWYDQYFGRNFAPGASVSCPTALRVGATQHGLDVIIVASHGNTAPVVAAAGGTITLTLYQSDSQDGTFEEVGPTICVKAPAGGISAEPCFELARFAIGDFKKPWLKVKLECVSVTGGNIDCALHYAAR